MADSKKYDGSQWEHSLRKLTTATDTFTTLPVDIYADGNNATVGISGNTVQNGTPTPSNPVDVNGVGERTENWFDGQLQQGYYAYATGDYTLGDNYVCTHLIPCIENTTYTFRCINTGGGSKSYGYVFFDSSQNRIGADYINALTEGDVVTRTATTPQNTAFLAINIAYGRRIIYVHPSDITDFMLNTGSTAKPFEPYGYKIPISSANTTTPVYLGEVQTTRKIKKVVLDGTESGMLIVGNENHIFAIRGIFNSEPNLLQVGGVCTHFKYNNAVLNLAANMQNGDFVLNKIVDDYSFTIKNDSFNTVNDFKTYLQQQYAAGTPVTVWYVLATPQTAIVNEPIRKIGGYADTVSGITIPTITGKDTFDVETALKPSEVELTYTGWHDAECKEWDGSDWQ